MTTDALYYEYTKAANPIGSGIISKVPYRSFLPELYADGQTRAVVLDLSAELQTPWPATGPGCAQASCGSTPETRSPCER